MRSRPVDPRAAWLVTCVVVAGVGVGCWSTPRPTPAAPDVVADLRARADQLSAEGEQMRREATALNARGRTADGGQRLAEGERKLTEAKMLRDKALLAETPVPAE